MKVTLLTLLLLLHTFNIIGQKTQIYQFKIEETFLLNSSKEISEVIPLIKEKEKSRIKNTEIQLNFDKRISGYINESNIILRNFGYELIKSTNFLTFDLLKNGLLSHTNVRLVSFNKRKDKFFFLTAKDSCSYLFYNEKLYRISKLMRSYQFWGDTIIAMSNKHGTMDTSFIYKFNIQKTNWNFDNGIDTLCIIASPVVSRTANMSSKLFVCDDKWIYEDVGTTYIDGINYTKKRKYQRTKCYCLNGKPFCFYILKKESGYRISYNNNDLGTMDYDKIFLKNFDYFPIITNNKICFYAKKDSSWYRVRIF